MDVPFPDADQAREWMEQLMEKLDVISEKQEKINNRSFYYHIFFIFNKQQPKNTKGKHTGY